MESLKDLLDRLNATDECTTIEAKKGSSIDHSVVETVCSFSNEPGLGGGYLILGVVRDSSALFPYYTATGINDSDKLQMDLATQCASMFNQPVRPEIEIEKNRDGISVMKIFVPELPEGQKPLYFKSEGLPRGAYRRIGSTDQRCTDDDLFVFYNKEDSLDSTPIKDTSLDDVSEVAIQLYRSLRAKVNPYAEELNYTDAELLKSLGCLKPENGKLVLTYAGLLVFGKREALRRVLPMVRVDYIRVTGNEWVPDPEKRFTTIDMRGPLIELVQRTFNAIADDLPKGFLLPEGQLQAENVGLPSKVLREALVNAFMHRTYRVNEPLQVIRYGNRIEIKNPGFSLKPDDQLGEPGSKNRNPFIAAIFHETNLAETKGSGIRTMRLLMESAGMVPPTFESNHGSNEFTTRLLLHHFLSEDDLNWLARFEEHNFTDGQKKGLIFVRETGAIDNATYRQLNGYDILRASSELRALRDFDFLEQKGKGRATYYVQGIKLKEFLMPLNSAQKSSPVPLKTTETLEYQLKTDKTQPLSAPPRGLSTPVHPVSTPPSDTDKAPVNIEKQEMAFYINQTLPELLVRRIQALKKRNNDITVIENLILELCTIRSQKLQSLAELFQRDSKYILRKFIQPMIEQKKIQYTFPDMPNHPDQSYTL